MVASLPKPPKVENTTKGVKEAASTHFKYSLHALVSSQVHVYRAKILPKSGDTYRCIRMEHSTVKTCTLSYDLPQNSLAWISAQASSLQLADIGTRALPVSGCEGGSTATSDMAHLMGPACSQIFQFIIADEN